MAVYVCLNVNVYVSAPDVVTGTFPVSWHQNGHRGMQSWRERVGCRGAIEELGDRDLTRGR